MAGTSTEPRGGLYDHADVSTGESGWAANLIANTQKISRWLGGLHVLDRDLTAPPGGETAGDAYIPAATATDEWAGHEDEFCVWDGSAYVCYTIPVGTLIYLEDEEKLCVMKAAGLSAGIAI